MSKFFSLVLFFPVLLILVLLLAFARYTQLSVTEADELALQSAANSANDAAVELAKTTSHINIFGQVTMNPAEVWQEYKRAFLRAMNLYSDRNMERFEAYCPAAVCAVNDGYYMRVRTMADGQPRFVWSQKIPYARQVVREDGSEFAVADTLNGSFIYGYGPLDSAVAAPVVWGDVAPLAPDYDEHSDVKESSIHNPREIAYELVRAVDYAVSLENAALSSSTFAASTFFLPKALVDELYYDTVTFEGLSLIVLIQDFNMTGGKPLSYYTVSNTQLVESDRYGLYRYGGKNLYSPLQPNPALPDYNEFCPEEDRCVDVVSNAYEAAQRGFYPDIRYYQLD